MALPDIVYLRGGVTCGSSLVASPLPSVPKTLGRRRRAGALWQRGPKRQRLQQRENQARGQAMCKARSCRQGHRRRRAAQRRRARDPRQGSHVPVAARRRITKPWTPPRPIRSSGWITRPGDALGGPPTEARPSFRAAAGAHAAPRCRNSGPWRGARRAHLAVHRCANPRCRPDPPAPGQRPPPRRKAAAARRRPCGRSDARVLKHPSRRSICRDIVHGLATGGPAA